MRPFTTPNLLITLLALVLNLGAASPAVALPASTELTQGWMLVSTNVATGSGATISQLGYNTTNWYPITLPSTIMAGLVANGVYTNLFMGTNQSGRVQLQGR